MSQPAACWQRVYGDYLVSLHEAPIPDTPVSHKIAGWWRVEVRDPAGTVLLSSSAFTFPLVAVGDADEAKQYIDQIMDEINLEPPRSDWRRCP